MSRSAAKAAGIYRMDLAGEGAFGDEPAANIFTYVRTVGVQLNLDTAAMANAVQRQVDAPLERIIGRNTGTLVTRHYLHGHDSADPAAAPSSDDTETTQTGAHGMDFLRRILASAIGNMKAGGVWTTTAGLGASGTPTDVIELTTISGFGPGEALMWKTGDDGLPYCVGWLQGIDTSATPDEGSLLQTTPFADPGSSGDTIWSAYNIFTPSTHDGSNSLDPAHDVALSGQTNNAVSWAAQLTGLDSDDVYELSGMRPTQLVIRPFAEIPEYEITWAIASWDEPGTGGGAEIGTWAFPEPEDPIGNFWCAWGAAHSDGSGGGSLPVMDMEITIALTRPEQKDPSMSSGVGGWPCTQRDISVSLTVYRDVSEEVADFSAQTGRPFTFQMGSAPGKIFALCLPNARVSAYPSRGDSDGLVTAQVTLVPDYYNGDNGDTDGDASDDVSRSELTPYQSHFRIALF